MHGVWQHGKGAGGKLAWWCGCCLEGVMRARRSALLRTLVAAGDQDGRSRQGERPMVARYSVMVAAGGAGWPSVFEMRTSRETVQHRDRARRCKVARAVATRCGCHCRASRGHLHCRATRANACAQPLNFLPHRWRPGRRRRHAPGPGRSPHDPGPAGLQGAQDRKAGAGPRRACCPQRNASQHSTYLHVMVLAACG